MKRLRAIISGLLFIILMLCLVTSGHTASGSGSVAGAEIASAPIVALHAASGASILFRAQEGAVVEGASRSGWNVPHLVLRRNGRLTDPDERTLAVEVRGITVPPPGITVTVQVETQHGDPDPPEGAALGSGGADVVHFLASGSERRIRCGASRAGWKTPRASP